MMSTSKSDYELDQLKVAMLLDNPYRPDLRVRREAQSLVQQGAIVTVFAWDRDIGVERASEEWTEGIQIIRIPAKSEQQLGIKQIPVYLRFAWSVFCMIMQQSFDVVHCHDFLCLPIGITIKMFKRIPVVYDAHEIYWIMEAKKYPQWILTILRSAEIILVRWIDCFITVGEKRAEYYQQYYSDQIFIVGNWYDPQDTDPVKRRLLRNNLQIPEDAIVIAYAGTLSPVRATQVLLDCADYTLEEEHQIYWLFCGKGPSEHQVEQKASHNPQVHFLGWIEDISTVFSAADVLVYLMMPSHPYTEYNSPNTLYLSIAWNRPLIAVNAGEIKYVLSTGVNGILLDEITVESVYRAASNLCNNESLYEQLQNGLAVLQTKYSWSKAQEQLWAAYQVTVA